MRSQCPPVRLSTAAGPEEIMVDCSQNGRQRCGTFSVDNILNALACLPARYLSRSSPLSLPPVCPALPTRRKHEEQLSKIGKADHLILIHEHAGWDQDCDAIAHPALYLDEPPQHGQVCARIENIKIHSMYVGTESQCIGHTVRGVQLIYRPDEGYAGNDRLRYAAQYPSVRRTIAVFVTVATHPSGPLGAAPSPITASTPQPRQSSGPVPACADLVF